MNKQPKYYSQYDPQWAKIPYTIDGDKNETISYSGCGPTCMAMLLATWHNPEITPPECCTLAIQMNDRTANDGTAWSFFGHMATRYGFDFEQTDSTSKAVEAIKNGALVICSMGPGFFTKGGHFILAYNVDAEDIAVNDPANKDRTRASIKTFINECRQYFILKKKEVVKKMEDKKVVGKEANDELLAVGFLHSDHTATLDQPATEGMVLNLINALRKELKGEMKI